MTVLTQRHQIRLSSPISVHSLVTHHPLRSGRFRLRHLSLLYHHHHPHNINAENLHVAVTSSAGRKKATKTTSRGRRTHSYSSDESAARIANKPKRTPRRLLTVSWPALPRNNDRPIFPKRSASSGRVCRRRRDIIGSSWRRRRRRSMSRCIPITYIDLSGLRIRRGDRRAGRQRLFAVSLIMTPRPRFPSLFLVSVPVTTVDRPQLPHPLHINLSSSQAST